MVKFSHLIDTIRVGYLINLYLINVVIACNVELVIFMCGCIFYSLDKKKTLISFRIIEYILSCYFLLMCWAISRNMVLLLSCLSIICAVLVVNFTGSQWQLFLFFKVKYILKTQYLVNTHIR